MGKWDRTESKSFSHSPQEDATSLCIIVVLKNNFYSQLKTPPLKHHVQFLLQAIFYADLVCAFLFNTLCIQNLAFPSSLCSSCAYPYLSLKNQVILDLLLKQSRFHCSSFHWLLLWPSIAFFWESLLPKTIDSWNPYTVSNIILSSAHIAH